MTNREVLFELNNVECFEAIETFDFNTKTIIIEYYTQNLTDYGILIPISKKMLRYIKQLNNNCTLILKTNVGIELHSSEVKNNKWNEITILR